MEASNPIKVIYLVSRLRAGGPSNQLKYIIEHLDPVFKPLVVTLSSEEGATALPEFESSKIPVKSLNLSRYSGLFRGPRRLRRLVREIEPDIVHSQGIRPDLLSALFLNSVERVATVRNYPFDDYMAKYGSLKGGIMALIHLGAFRGLETPVACSRSIRESTAQHGVKLVIQNGVEHKAFCPSESSVEKKRLRQNLGLPVDRPILVSVGSLIRRKDPCMLIEGFEKSAASENCTLLMLGEGPLVETCKRQVGDSSDVRFAGFVENVDEYLKASDYFVSASHSEGLPNTVLEALSTGLPVCLSDIGPHREILTLDDGVGNLFPTGNANSLARAIDQLLDADLDAQSSRARKLIEENLSAHQMSVQYQRLYLSIKDNKHVKVADE